MANLVHGQVYSLLNHQVIENFVIHCKMDLFGRNYKIYHYCMDICHWKQMVHLGWIGGSRIVQFLLHVTTNISYHHPRMSLSWLSPKAKNVWNICKSNARWWKILQRGWHAFYAKVIIWRVVIGGRPFGSALKRRGLGLVTCFFCTFQLEDNTHRLNKYPIVCIIWKYLSDIWQILTRYYLRPQHWVGFFLICSEWSKCWAWDIAPIFKILGTKIQLKYA